MLTSIVISISVCMLKVSKIQCCGAWIQIWNVTLYEIFAGGIFSPRRHYSAKNLTLYMMAFFFLQNNEICNPDVFIFLMWIFKKSMNRAKKKGNICGNQYIKKIQ